MPGPIRDHQIRQVVQELENRTERNVDDKEVVRLLGAIGDRGENMDGEAKLLTEQLKSKDRQTQFDIVKPGVSEKERADIESLLRHDDIQLSPGARNFLEALIDKAPLGQNWGPLVIESFEAGLQGVANAGDVIEIVNVSSRPENAYSADAMEVSADEWGRFQSELPNVQEGDHLRVRTRGANGHVGNWIQMQVQGTGKEDVQNAQMWTDALGMEADEQGVVDLVYLGDGMVSEPNANLRLTNERTGKNFDVTLDANGRLPEGFQIQGKPGDTVSIALSDGSNNTDFTKVAGTVAIEEKAPAIDLKDPGVWAKKHLDADGNPKFTVERFTGPLFVDEPSHLDVKQGSLADCYFCAAASAVAATDPGKIKNMIKQNVDGTYSVTFQVPNAWGQFEAKTVNVDGDLYTRSSGGRPLYGSGTNSQAQDKMELWFPILEKAYAKLHENDYDKIGNGGNPGYSMMLMTGGVPSRTKVREPSETTDGNLDSLYRKIEKGIENGHPITVSTYGKDSEEASRYPGTGMYAWHIYTVLGVEEKDGQKFVQMRNPWGQSEPGYDGENDGVFLLELETFGHLCKQLTVVKD